ncbi:MAG: hypothetical protein RI601_05540 [Desulfurivibrionaceae bacterium]|nr:hypothetical protein [Desulfurivibrionaceae bacterium]
MALGLRLVVRTVTLLFYGALLVGIYGGLHFFMATPVSIQESREYGNGQRPDYFPVLVVDGEGDSETLVLRSLARQEYAGQTEAAERPWSLYRLPGEGSLLHGDRVRFKVESLSEKRQQIEIAIEEANGQRTSLYTYLVEGQKVSPRSYRLLASFGDNFSPLPFTLLLTVLLIFLTEKFLVRRRLPSSSGKQK